MAENPFFCVVQENSNNISGTFDLRADAAARAKELAKANIGTKYYVLKSIGIALAPRPDPAYADVNP